MGKITHIHPQAGIAGQTPVGDGVTQDEVFDEIRSTTLLNSDVLLVETHQYAVEECLRELGKDCYDKSRVSVLPAIEVTKTLHLPAQRDKITHSLVSAGSGKVVGVVEVPAQAARTKTYQSKVYLDFATKQHALHIRSKVTPSTKIVVVWEPDADGGDLDYINELPKHIELVIFHQVSDKCGVVIEGSSQVDWQNSFHTKTEALTMPENVDVVVRGLCNVNSVAMWGALPKHGKSYLFMSIMKALLTGKSWLDYFEVSQAKRVVYLVPEVGLRGVMKRLRKLGMVDHLYDPATNPEGKLFIQTLSSKQKLKLDDWGLLQAVKGADVFVDPIIRYIEGEENNASDQRMLSNKLLALISAEGRSVWCAHHSPKAFKDVTDITTQNVLRGTGEFAAFPDIIFGVLKTNDETGRLYIRCTDARDDDEYLGDFEVEMRPWIDETGDLKLVVAPGTGTPLREQKRSTTKPGPKKDPDRQAKIDFAKGFDGSIRETTKALNEKFKTKHVKSYVQGLLKEAAPFDVDGGEEDE